MPDSTPPETIEDALAARLCGLKHDPLGHVLFSYPWGEPGTELERHKGPRKWQRQVLERIGEKLRAGAALTGEVIQEAVASGHGIGKSALVAWIVRWALDTHVDTKVVVTANTEGQLRTKTWPEVSKWNRLAITSHWWECTATALVSRDPAHVKEWRADAIPWSDTNTQAFAGLHNEGKRILLVFDEASEISDKIWEVAEGALTDQNTEIIWCAFGNPTSNVGRFRECFRKFKHRWSHAQIDSRTVEGVNLVQINKWIADFGVDSDFVKVRVRGIFPTMAAKQYFAESDIDAAYGRHLRPEQYQFAPKILTCDPAWEGDDELIIALRQGLYYQVLRVLPKNDNDIWVANEIARLEDEHDADAVIIDGGYGTGIVSAGRTMRRSWQLVWFSGESNDPGCLNKRAEMHSETKKWLKAGGAIPDDPILRDEMNAIEAVPRMDGMLQMESKKELKKRIGRSPNRLDGLCLSFAIPVSKKARHTPVVQNYTSQAYDPLANM